MHLVILMGIQGVGKSTFYLECFATTHTRINLDELKTRHREKQLFQRCLAEGQPAVIDNTNPSPADRERYIIPAKAAGFRVTGYYFQSVIADALARNARREGAARVPDKAILGTAGRLELPNRLEGFDELFYVSIPAVGGFDVKEWNDEV